jgi:hypothetical protein
MSVGGIPVPVAIFRVTRGTEQVFLGDRSPDAFEREQLQSRFRVENQGDLGRNRSAEKVSAS